MSLGSLNFQFQKEKILGGGNGSLLIYAKLKNVMVNLLMSVNTGVIKSE